MKATGDVRRGDERHDFRINHCSIAQVAQVAQLTQIAIEIDFHWMTQGTPHSRIVATPAGTHSPGPIDAGSSRTSPHPSGYSRPLWRTVAWPSTTTTIRHS